MPVIGHAEYTIKSATSIISYNGIDDDHHRLSSDHDHGARQTGGGQARHHARWRFVLFVYDRSARRAGFGLVRMHD